MFEALEALIRDYYGKPEEYIPLHEPVFIGNEKKYLEDCVESTFVSSVGQYVDRFSDALKAYTGAKYAIPVVNGTAALHLSLVIAGVKENDEIITQPLTFIATANAISYLKANPVFLDVDMKSMGLCPEKLESFLKKETSVKNGKVINKNTGNVIKACVPMHSFGLCSDLSEIARICKKYNITLIEDAAESLGTFQSNQHSGTFGDMGTLSFNGNKIITAGGGGAIITNNSDIAEKALHLSTQAKIKHSYRFIHDEIGYNYRMPNINASLALAQLEKIDILLQSKRAIHEVYQSFFEAYPGYDIVDESFGTKSNYWLNVLLVKDTAAKITLIEKMNERGIMLRPAWDLIPTLRMYQKAYKYNIDNAVELEQRIVNLTSSAKV